MISFLSIFMIFIVSIMLPYDYPVLSICLEYPVLMLCLTSQMFSYYLLLNDRPACPMYFHGQLTLFILHISHFSRICLFRCLISVSFYSAFCEGEFFVCIF
jgi:hypothetical protein